MYGTHATSTPHSTSSANTCRSFERNTSTQRRRTRPVAVSGEGHHPDREVGSGRETPKKWKGVLGSGPAAPSDTSRQADARPISFTQSTISAGPGSRSSRTCTPGDDRRGR